MMDVVAVGSARVVV